MITKGRQDDNKDVLMMHSSKAYKKPKINFYSIELNSKDITKLFYPELDYKLADCDMRSPA